MGVIHFSQTNQLATHGHYPTPSVLNSTDNSGINFAERGALLYSIGDYSGTL